VNGTPAGQLRSHKNFSFLRVYDAGHMVPMDQPEVSLAMLSTFMTRESAPQFSEVETLIQQ